MIIYKKSAVRHLIEPLKRKGYEVELVGSLSGFFKRSHNDIDILLTLPKPPETEKIFSKFEADLKLMGWKYNFSDEKEGFGIFHNYRKRGIGLDIWTEEI